MIFDLSLFPRLVMGARGAVAGGGGERGPGSGGLGWAGGYLGAARRGLSRAGVAGRAVAPGRRNRGTPRLQTSEGGRLGGDGALGWVAGERPNIIAFLPTPPPLFGFLSFSFPVLLSFFLFSSPAPFCFLPSLFFLPSFPFFVSLLKERGIVGNPSVLPTWKKSCETCSVATSTRSFSDLPSSINMFVS